MNNTNADWYNMHFQEYYERSKIHYHPVLQKDFLALLPKKGSVLDHGCGFGRDSKLFQDAGHTVVGIDLSKELLKMASGISPKSTFQLCDISVALPFRDMTFDGVWSMTTLIHLRSLEEVEFALKEIFRVLKPGGVVHIITGYKFDDTRLFVTETTPPRSFFRMTVSELGDICNKIGFQSKTCRAIPETEMTNDARNDVTWLYYLGTKP
jgi:SAM-dependent methyltransferase